MSALTLKNFCPSLMVILLLMGGCHAVEETSLSTDELYALFTDPPAEARPFVRWWWNGDCIEVDELRRELDVMKAAGIGGVEVNPIAKPEGGDDFDYRCYEWLSHEWNERVKATAEMARERDMIVDLIMGSGWPFGGEFLSEDQFLQGVGIRKMTFEGPREISLELEGAWQLPGRNFGEYNNPYAPEPELFFLQMIPHGASGVTDLTDLMNEVEDGRVLVKVPAGKHDLYIGTFQKAYRTVMHGAPGSAGPVVNHYDAADVRAYMERLAHALEAVLGGKLGDHIRALFCDSIELSGANITDDFFEEFIKRRGYDLKPFIPLVYYHPYEGYTDTLMYDPAFNDDIRRIRYDFNKTLVELFLERFTTTFDDWANEHGMQSRYQAYGMPWLVGMLDGYRMVDIPESNNWLYSANAKAHGYWIWNKYTSSAAHLTGAGIVSCEAMTNTRGVFRMPLGMVKKNDDFNFITGINHSVLHGYNYSPPEAGFPGWVRYGAYFSDQNTWWPYFRHWADYNARLSAVLQHSEPVTDIAIMTPTADIWRQWGLNRYPFYMNPWYNHDLWEAFSRLGVMADYVNEGVLQRAIAEKGRLKSEMASYQLVIVSGARAIETQTAEAIDRLAAEGVKFLFVDRLPSEAPGYLEKEKNDRRVREMMGSASSRKNVSITDAPEDALTLTGWAEAVVEEQGIQSGLSLSPVNRNVYTLKHRNGSDEIYFFSNQDERNSLSFEVAFSHKKKTAWYWDPFTGKRSIYPGRVEGTLDIQLQALESVLIVLQDKSQGETLKLARPDESSGRIVGSGWEIDFYPFKDQPFTITTARLIDFGTQQDKRMATFAGKAIYRKDFELDDTEWDFLDLGLEKQVSEVKVNGQDIGVKWWGRHLYRLPAGALKEGENRLEIAYTTTLANYANSLTGNRAARQWINLSQPDPMGLRHEVRLLKALPASPE